MEIYRVTEMSAIAPLFSGSDDTLITSTLAGCTGVAYADQALTTAMIVNGDFAFSAGDATGEAADMLMRKVPPMHSPGKLLFTPPDAAWEQLVRNVWGKQAVESKRFSFHRDAAGFNSAKLTCLQESLPAGYRLARMDGHLYRQAYAHEWSRDLVSLFQNEADYLARGIGVAVLQGDDLVAGASSYAVFPGGIEIEIDTRADKRGMGLATACGAALILLCLERGLYPNWDAANPVSASLAKKFGYIPKSTYSVYEIALTL